LGFVLEKTLIVLLCCLPAILTSRKSKHNHTCYLSESTVSHKNKLAAELTSVDIEVSKYHKIYVGRLPSLSFSYSNCFTLLNTWQQFDILIKEHLLLITPLSKLPLEVVNHSRFQYRLNSRQFGLQHATHQELSRRLYRSRDRCVSVFQENYVGVISIFNRIALSLIPLDCVEMGLDVETSNPHSPCKFTEGLA